MLFLQSLRYILLALPPGWQESPAQSLSEGEVKGPSPPQTNSHRDTRPQRGGAAQQSPPSTTGALP